MIPVYRPELNLKEQLKLDFKGKATRMEIGEGNGESVYIRNFHYKPLLVGDEKCFITKTLAELSVRESIKNPKIITFQKRTYTVVSAGRHAGVNVSLETASRAMQSIHRIAILKFIHRQEILQGLEK